LKAKIIVYQGADDQWTAGGIPEFEAEMKAAKADWKLESYPGAVHSFTVKEAGDNPASGMAYNAEADRRSWESLTAFLTGLFK
jgi:dienelactone hydrolase